MDLRIGSHNPDCTSVGTLGAHKRSYISDMIHGRMILGKPLHILVGRKPIHNLLPHHISSRIVVVHRQAHKTGRTHWNRNSNGTLGGNQKTWCHHQHQQGLERVA